MTDAFVISHRFNGPPSSGNGGYVAGRLARELQRRHGRADAVEVTLRAALPLDRPLGIVDRPDGGIALRDGDRLLAEASATRLAPDVPPAPTLDEARAAGAIGRMRSASNASNPYRHCFGCGLERAAHDGLRIVPSPIDEDSRVASDWVPDAAFADPDGTVWPEAVWAALDCPAGFAWGERLGGGNAGLLTGRITLALVDAVRAGEPYVVAGWPLERDGRKLHAGTALYDAGGRPVAYSRQLWFAPRA
jgi:hypothetical protein